MIVDIYNLCTQLLITLMPKGHAFRIPYAPVFLAILDAIGQELWKVRNFYKKISSDVYPDSTTLIPYWEQILGLPYITVLSDTHRRARLGLTWAASGGQTAQYLEGIISNIGLPIKMYENLPLRDPATLITAGIYSSVCGANHLGDGATMGVEVDAVDLLANSYKDLFMPVSPIQDKWIYYILISSVDDVGKPIIIPKELGNSIKDIILRVKPAHVRVLLNFRYI